VVLTAFVSDTEFYVQQMGIKEKYVVAEVFLILEWGKTEIENLNAL